MDNESELPIQYFNFKNSDKNSDILSLHPSLSLIDLENLDKKNQIFPEHFQEEQASEMELSEVDSEKAQEYFNLLFSPKVVTQSLVRRNQYLEMKCLENSESEPEEIYHKRKQRVNNLEKKERKNWEILLDMKKSQPDRYVAFTKLMKLLGEVKTKLNGIRHDYYSEKTFLTLKKSSPEQLLSLTKILSSILISVTQNKSQSNSFIYSGPQNDQAEKQLSEIYLQFLIIPRFFISREKLLKFLKDEKLQQNFTFLIYNHCLGHYNNEANKKLPQEKQIQFIRQLFESQNGKEEKQGEDAREKFKKICVINHGGKFIKRYGELYYQLYGRSLECLRKVDVLAKERGSREEIMEEFARDRSQEQQQRNIEVIEINSIQNFNLNLNFNPNPNIISFNLDPHLLYPPSSFLLQQLQNHSINSFLNSELKPTILENKLTKTSSLFKSNLIEIHQTMVDGRSKEKEKEGERQEKEEGLRPKIRRINSLVDEKKEGSEEEGRVRSGFRVKRWLTMEAQRQNNIIIVHPPNKGHMDDQLI